MDGHDHPTARRLMAACEQAIREAATPADVTARRIAALAETNLSAIAYHFGSQEGLIVAVAEGVYRRLNGERLDLLHKAVARRAPAPADLGEVIAALVGPSIRWSLSPDSAYRVLSHLVRVKQQSPAPERYRAIVEGVGPHRAFIRVLARLAPWFSEDEIGWRVNAALGIRSQVVRDRARTAVLSGHGIDLSDPEAVLAAMVAVIAPMFARPPAPVKQRPDPVIALRRPRAMLAPVRPEDRRRQ